MNPLFDIKLNQIKMVAARGFVIPNDERGFLDSNIKADNFEQWLSQVKDQILRDSKIDPSKRRIEDRVALTKVYISNTGNSLYVYYAPTAKSTVGVNVINDFKIKATNMDQNILILPQDLSSDAQKLLHREMANRVQIFMDMELRYNPTEHILVPRHQLLTENEITEILKQINVDRHQLPQMKADDIIARYYDAREGSVFRIYRNDSLFINTLNGESIAYRVVI